MGIRGELFSTKVTCEGRTYFFNVKQNRMGDVFLSIVESKPTEAENFDRRSIVIFRDDMRGFLKAFQTTLGFMEKPGTTAPEMTFEPKDGPAPRPRSRATSAASTAKRTGAAPSDAGTPSDASAPAGTEKKRRVIVRKKKNEGGDSRAD